MLVAGALSSAQAPASSPPDLFVTQVTNSARDSFAGDTSANGRFVVIESNGDVATEKTDARNNQDGNREIFLYDYAQRRIFQLTNTKSVLNPPGSPSPTPSPSPSPSPSVSPSPTASPTPTPVDPTNVKIEVSNNRPMISLEGAVPVAGQHTYTIVFSSNAPVTPASFDGTDPGAPTNTDMNQEIWTYQVPPVSDVDLTTGADVPFQDLSAGAFTRITNTAASQPPVAGPTTSYPRVADDNRDATISDDGQVIAFVSTRSLPGGTGNADANPEVYLFNRTTGIFTQVTNTVTTSIGNPIFNENPSLAGSGSSYVLAFISNANLTGTNDDDGQGNGNAEDYVATYNGAAVSSLKQVTKTKDNLTTGATSNVFSIGRRVSRDGKWLLLESLASDPKANGTNTLFYVPFIYDIVNDAFAQVGTRALTIPGDIAHFPTFTDYNNPLSPLSPGAVVFTSALNFKSDGTFPAATTADPDSNGLNPSRAAQIFLTPMNPSVQTTGPFTRITNIPGGKRPIRL